jgi:hypothetical protein
MGFTSLGNILAPSIGSRGTKKVPAAIARNQNIASQPRYLLRTPPRIGPMGSSGTVALASAVAADIITSAERGIYMGFTSLGNIRHEESTGCNSKEPKYRFPAQILAKDTSKNRPDGFPETCRGIVGNGSTPAVGWNRAIWSYLRTTTTLTPPESTGCNSKEPKYRFPAQILAKDTSKNRPDGWSKNVRASAALLSRDMPRHCGEWVDSCGWMESSHLELLKKHQSHRSLEKQT